MEGTDCSQLATASTLYSACCCEGAGSAAAPAQASGSHQNRTHSSSSNSPALSCACPCACSPHPGSCTHTSACGCSPVHAGADQEEQLKQVNSVFSAAEAALQAFWRSSLTKVGMNVESAGSEAGYRQVRTAARSQAAASIAWVLAAASVVLKEDTEEDDDNDNAAHAVHFQHQGTAGAQSYPMHGRNFHAPGHTHNMVRRPDVQLSRSAAGSSYYKSNMHTASSSFPRWEWRPVRNSNTSSNESCMGTSPPCPPSPSATHLSKLPLSCSSTISGGEAEAPEPSSSLAHGNPNCGVASITISSLLPPLINCRISNTPYNQENLENAKVINPKQSNPTTQTQLLPLDHDANLANQEPNCTIKAWSTPLINNDNVAIDIIDTKEVTKTLVEPFHMHEETLEEPPNIDKNIIDEEEKSKEKNVQNSADSPQALRSVEDNTFSFISCVTSSSDDLNTSDGKPTANLQQEDMELSSINTSPTFQGGKNHKKHLKKKQRKASTSHL